MAIDMASLIEWSQDPSKAAPALPTPGDLLESMGADRPELQPLLNYFKLQQEVVQVEQELAVEEDSTADLLAQASEEAAQLRRRLRRVGDEIDDLRRRSDRLAAALGACFVCWGEDIDCPECGGSGGPGAYAPDGEEFAEWVAPTLRSMKAALAPAAPAPTHPGPSPPAGLR